MENSSKTIDRYSTTKRINELSRLFIKSYALYGATTRDKIKFFIDFINKYVSTCNKKELVEINSLIINNCECNKKSNWIYYETNLSLIIRLISKHTKIRNNTDLIIDIFVIAFTPYFLQKMVLSSHHIDHQYYQLLLKENILNLLDKLRELNLDL
ncbi:hypothetical protein [Tolumonas lignilytica]|uniref:hypothetical protein n=1 Tax=Tolumonas lignilytica TaxID=1283284 RepID=UPI000464E28C|nr:hypothetical protein [Tolumonas lignilytica]